MSIPTHHIWGVAIAALAAVGCGGSGDGLPRQAISGQVILDGKPLESGMITFAQPSGAEPVASAFVENGAYTIARADGPIPGAHRVSIWSRKPTGRKVRNPDDPSEMIEEVRDIIPPRYGSKSELTAEIKEGETNAFDFSLESAKVASRGRSPK